MKTIDGYDIVKKEFYVFQKYIIWYMYFNKQKKIQGVFKNLKKMRYIIRVSHDRNSVPSFVEGFGNFNYVLKFLIGQY